MSELVSLIDGEAVTSSLAIAEGTGNDHASVMRLIRKHVVDFDDFGRVRFEIRPFETAGGAQQREIALLNEHHATLLITFMRNVGVVKEFKKKLVKAFWALTRGRQQLAIPQTLPEALRFAANLADQKAKAEMQLALAIPKVQALDRLATHSDGSFCVRDAAKTLQVQEKALRRVLLARRWLYHRPAGAGLLAYADKLQQGVLEHKIMRGEKSDGSEWISTQPRITAKGIVRLAEIFCAKGAPL
ncbi:MAG: phage regulatory protein/antirepressor Ant [Ottowia sp.]|nr:phage regulatory protein/antirepressor Ant [Ottowia sp.]